MFDQTRESIEQFKRGLLRVFELKQFKIDLFY